MSVDTHSDSLPGFTFRVTESISRTHTHGTDGGRVMCKLHAVRGGGDYTRAVCGLKPQLGWGENPFSGGVQRCVRCVTALGALRVGATHE